MKIFFDGGCRPNPGEMEVAVVAAGRVTLLRDIGYGTNTDAEWLALIHALRVAQTLGTTDVVLLGDARHVIDQANGAAGRSRGSARHLETFYALASAGPAPRIRYIRRAQNLAGIALARLHPR